MILEKKLLSFDDVLIEPQFSKVRSRKDVDVSTEFLGMKLSLPVLNSNMDTVASPSLCRALAEYGTVGTLHRFWSVEENVQAFKNSILGTYLPIVSIGIGDIELQRAEALYNVGARIFMLDVAHAANIAAVEMYCRLKINFPTCKFIVGDFGTGAEIKEFIRQANMLMNDVTYSFIPDAVKVGIGIGSVCHTKLVTGVGSTALNCLMDCAPIADERNIKLVLDGGVKYIGDIAKALVAGADIVISGTMFAGTEEAAGEFVSNGSGKFKAYRGSASNESYIVQNKVAPWRAPEGEATLVPYKGPVINILNNISGGLRSSCSYVNAFNLNELRSQAKFNFI